MTGTNDNPTLNLTPPLTVSEHGATVQGWLSATDPDTGDTLTFSNYAPVQGFTLHKDGSYSFDPTHPAYTHLAPGQSQTLSIPVTATESNGTTDTHVMQIKVTGADDAPVFTLTPPYSASEGGGSIHGQLIATDTDTSDRLTYYSVNPTHPALTLKPDGGYTLDSSYSSLQNLGEGETYTIRTRVIATDSHGAASAEQVLNIVVTGTNDAPTVTSVVDLGATREDTAMIIRSADLLAHVSDADVHDMVTITGIRVDPQYGAITANADGTWTFTPAHNLSVDDIPFSFTAIDHKGGATTGQAQLDITAVADVPVSSMAESVSTDFATPTITGHGGTWGSTDPTVWGWQTDNPDGMVEHGRGSAYGDASGGNVGIVELEGYAHTPSNLYREIHSQAGAHYHLHFDLSGRVGASSQSAGVEVLWEGKVVDTIHPAANTFGFVPHTYDLVATGDASRIELRAVTQDGSGPVVDNLEMGFVGLSGVEDTALPINLNLHLTDTDGSEIAGALVKQLPVGFPITDGAHTHTVQTVGEVLDATGWDMDHLSIRPPANFNGDVDVVVSATSTEQSNQDAATVDYPIKLTFAPMADPTVDAGGRDLGSTDEDTDMHFTAAQLLAGLSDSDGPLSVVDGSLTSPHGTLTGTAATGFTFTPSPDYHGDDVDISYKVTDGITETAAHTQVDVTSVVDQNAPDLIVAAQQEVMDFGAAKTGAVVQSNTMSAGGDMHQLTVDFTILGGQQVQAHGVHGATLLSCATPSDSNQFYIWNNVPGQDLTFRVGGHEYATSIPLGTDGKDHRYRTLSRIKVFRVFLG